MADNKRLAQWIAGCLRADEASQLALYRHYFSYGMSISLRYAKTPEAAREIVNDGFLKVFLKLEQYDSKRPFRPWLRQILVHAAIDYYRKYDAHQGEPYRVPEGELQVRNEALDQLAFEDVLPLIRQLPAAYRMVFNLYAVEHKSHAEIAETLGISVGTSKSNLAKARKKLKQMLIRSHGIHLKSEKYG